jgi:hypothetical protein
MPAIGNNNNGEPRPAVRPVVPEGTMAQCASALSDTTRRLAAVALASLLTACANTSGNGVTHYFGWVRVEQPQTSAREVVADHYTMVGLRVAGGVGLGYMREQRVYVPLDCRLVLLVRNQQELDRAIDQLQSTFGKDGVCVSPVNE